jgi:hypothetical protein
MKTSWDYETQSEQCGVSLKGESLSWWFQPNGPMGRFTGGGGCDQSLSEFLKYGPPYGGVPRAILRDMVRELGDGTKVPWLDPEPVTD